MTTPRPEHRPRRLQFGLRKLLLWTAVVAVYLGVFKTLNLGFIMSIPLGCWVVVVGVLRVEAGAKVAALASLITVTILGMMLMCLSLNAIAFGAIPVSVPLLYWLRLYLIGCVIFTVVEITVRAVDWADNLMKTENDRG